MIGELSRPVWSMLTGPRADLAVADGDAMRIDPEYGPFAAARDSSESAQAALAAIVRHSPHEVWLVEPEEWPAPARTRVVRTAPLLQMVASGGGAAQVEAGDIEALTGVDVPAMSELALATEPGPWGPKTHLYGQFYGIRDGSKLAAMAGERMQVGPNFSEVSGVCTWPEYRGQGMARRLISHVMQSQRARGKVPFLHSYAHNEGAIGLYKSLGFEPARELVVTVLAVA
ncbi:GNAT family N-acetyltransferase [uncultured Erythrobacter sp.]|uniref:GNAT family N-acetyltransferase n=1 Tax=uncultured Erythrobacter sp. TaxID=263913 RepID=UPI00262FF60F|nr:GNAT family N-acetyltransferase [uncultured Erythrobacter sp.]